MHLYFNEYIEEQHACIDPAVFHETRAGIPVTVQRRFDVYNDVSK